jgi:hypothetical protein
VQNTPKQAFYVKFWSLAKEAMVPLMVLYKVLNVYTSWSERGPKGAIYSL